MRRLILFDWDKTIIGGPSPLDSTAFKVLIAERQAGGWHVGLNSDTPVRRLKGWRDALGMNGPIIAEKGLVIWTPGAEEPQPICRIRQRITRLRARILSRLSEMPHTYLFFGGSLEFVSANINIPGGPGTVVAMDAYRLCSIGLLVRKANADGTLSTDEEVTKAVWDSIADMVAAESQSTRVDLSGTAVGFIGVHPLEASKSSGLRALLRHWPVDRVIMVGDSLPDYMTLPPGRLQVEHYAVSNAQNEYRSLPGVRQLTKPYLEGCIEFLASIAA